jgi:adenylate kinase
MRLVFLGPPGSGKGTQAKILSEKTNIPHISTGDIFRKNIKEQTELGRKASEYTSKGLLVPDTVTNEMVKKRLLEKDCKKGFILDGYPRTIPQAEFLDSVLKIDKVINFELKDEEVVRRISGRRTCRNCASIYNIYSLKPKKENICDKCQGSLVQRDDEKPDVVKKRLVVYKDQTEPLIDYYRKKKLLVDVDAYPSIEDVNSLLMKLL